MAGKILKSEFAEFEAIMDGLKGIAAEMEKIQKLSTSNAPSGLSGLTDNEKALNAARKESARQIKELDTLMVKLSVAQGERNKKIQETKILLKQENDQIKQNIVGSAEQIKINKLQAVVNKEVAGSYNALDAQYKLNIISLNKLTQEEIENSVAGKKLASDTKVIQSQLQAMDMTTARNRTGYNGLRFSMMQVGRELPSMAYGINVFMAAISNNIPMVTDEIKKAKLELAALKAEGKTGVPIWKQMAGAIFSWQTALVIGLTALTVYGKEIFSFLGKLFNVEKQLKATEIAQKSLTDAYKSAGEAIVGEKTKLEILYNASQNEKLSKEERLIAVNELQKLYPDYLENIDDESFLVGGATLQYEKLTQALIENARARAILDEIVSNEKKILPFEKELFDAIENESKATLNLFESKRKLATLDSRLDSREYLLQTYLIKGATGEIKKYQKEQENAINNIFTLGEANKELANFIAPSNIVDKEKDKKEKGDALTKARKQNEIEINKFIIQQEKLKNAEFLKIDSDLTLTEKENIDKKKDFEENQEKDLYFIKYYYNKQLYALAKKGSSDYLEIKKDESEILKDWEKQKTDSTEENRKRELDIESEYYKNKEKEFDKFQKSIKAKTDAISDETVAKIYENTNLEQLAESEKYKNKIKSAKGSEEKIQSIKDEYELFSIDNEIAHINEGLIDKSKLTLDDEEKLNKRLIDLGIVRNEKIAEINSRANKEELEKKQKVIDATQEIINAGFAFQQQLSDNQLARAERNHELELLSATESAEGRMAADAKYDKEKRKIEKRQATLKKASAAFNIVVDTAQAIMNFLATKGTLGIILAAAAGITGGIELATVLSEPIPAYNKGVEGAKGGISILGDKDSAGHGGVELVEEPSGKKWLSGSEPGLYNIVPGSDIYPSDETQKILAQQAFNNSFNIVGLGETNSILKDINKNTKNKIWFDGGKKFKQHGNIITEYV